MTWRAFIQLLVSMLGLAGGTVEQLPPITPGVSRRAFLKALGVSAVALAALPEAFSLDRALDLDEEIVGYSGFDLSQLDAILKEIYLPEIVRSLNQPSAVMRFMERPSR